VTDGHSLVEWPGRFLGLHQGLLIAALVGIAVIHTRSRIGGSLSTASWCVAAALYGWQQFAGRDGGLVFLGVQTPRWLYFSALAGVFAYNVAIAVRGLTRRVAAPASKATSPPPSP
jgi:hypothetical protein